MIIATTSAQRLDPDDHRAAGDSGPKQPKDVGQSMKPHRSAGIKRYRLHPRQIVPYSTAAIQTSNTPQAAAVANTAGIKSP